MGAYALVRVCGRQILMDLPEYGSCVDGTGLADEGAVPLENWRRRQHLTFHGAHLSRALLDWF